MLSTVTAGHWLRLWESDRAQFLIRQPIVFWSLSWAVIPQYVIFSPQASQLKDCVPSPALFSAASVIG